MKRWLGRPKRTHATSGEASLPLASSGPPPPSEFQFFRTLPGRLFLLSGALWLVLLIVQRVTPLPELLEIFRRVVALALLVASGWLAFLAVARNRRQLLWRVRRKLILSYVFLGFVPVILVMVFALAGGFLLYTNIAAYVFREGFDDLTEDVYQIAETSAGEIGRSPATAESALSRKYLNLSRQYPQLSLAVVPMASETNGGTETPPSAARGVSAGAWRHMAPLAAAPRWIVMAGTGFRGLVVHAPSAAPDELHLVIRAAVPTPDASRLVVADLPVDTDIVARLDDRTKTRLGDFAVPRACGGSAPEAQQAPVRGLLTMFRQTVAFMDCSDWTTGLTGRLSISLEAPVGRLYERLAAAQSAQFTSAWTSDAFLMVLFVLGGLFLVIQGSALVMGAVLARSITYAVHELFEGTERIRQGDFAHRISIESRDQLGDLAESFNRMSASIEHLLHVQREKQRLDDELRIARDIQKSLLPVAPPRLAGLSVADLCEPAREVGGDYYDFFELGPRQLGVLIADVSGKGTSAALYMAELKGLMLALSHDQWSPRRLMIDVNHLLAAHLDNRSFITMTYAIIDLDAGTLTCARGGHTPLIVVSAGKSEVVIPNGMVLGLRLPGASERFEQMLEEHVRPIAPGDVVVLYTDGITEAMDGGGELFGDAALAQVIAANHHLDAHGIRERVLREVKAFVGDAEPHDDMTMVVLKLADAEAAL